MGKAEEVNQEGIAYLQDGKIEQALEKFSEAIEQDRTFPYPYCHIGNVLSAAHQHEDAVPWFQKAIELDPEMGSAYYGLGNALYALEKPAEALDMFRQAEQKNLQNGDLYFMIGMCFMQQGKDNARRALAFFHRAVEFDPADTEAIFQRGLCAAYLQELDQAKQDFQAVIELDDQHADAHFNLGVAYAYEAHKDKALEHVEQALRLQPEHELAYHAKKQILGE
jgi:tetratricopeptide (TPR) repeat protein